MKRDPDTIRTLLTLFEEHEDWLVTPSAFDGLDLRYAVIINHINVMEDANLVAPYEGAKATKMGWRLTWEGYEFLEKTRDPEVWQKTKTAGGKLGSFSVSLLSELATGFVKAKAAEYGLPLG